MTRSRPVSILSAGLIAGLLSAFFSISYASLIFSGDLAPFLPTATTYFFQGSLIIGLTTALFSSLPGAIGKVQDVPAAMYAVLATAIAGGMTGIAAPEAILATVLAGLVLTTFVTGVGLFLLPLTRGVNSYGKRTAPTGSHISSLRRQCAQHTFGPSDRATAPIA